MAATGGFAAVAEFYPTATAVLIGLLVTWLVAEARDIRDTRLRATEAPIDASGSLAGQRDVGWILATSLLLASGALAALHVQYRGHAPLWERDLIWATLVLGFVSLIFSAVVTMLPTPTTSAAMTLRTVRSARRAIPLLAALAAGFVASPILGGNVRERIQRGGEYFVYGTCLSGGCGLKQRTGPGPAFPSVGKRLRDGTRVFVVCQAQGPPPTRFASPVWDRLHTGHYVSDAFVATQDRHGGFSSGHLPRCARSTPDQGSRG